MAVNGHRSRESILHLTVAPSHFPQPLLLGMTLLPLSVVRVLIVSLKYTLLALPFQSLLCNSNMLPSGLWSLGCLLLTLSGVPSRIPEAKLGAHWFSLSSPSPSLARPISLGLTLLGYAQHASEHPITTATLPLAHLHSAPTLCPELQAVGVEAQDPYSSSPVPTLSTYCTFIDIVAPCATPQGNLVSLPTQETSWASGHLGSQT